MRPLPLSPLKKRYWTHSSLDACLFLLQRTVQSLYAKIVAAVPTLSYIKYLLSGIFYWASYWWDRL